jgi:hypothetical protein
MPEDTKYARIVVGDRQNPSKILFEVTELEPAIEVEIGRGDGAIADGFHLEDICRNVSEVAGAVMRSLKALETKRTVLEFGVEIAADTGGLTALIVKGSGKANLKITAEW